MCELDTGPDGDVREILHAQRSGQFDLSARPCSKSVGCAFGEKRRAAGEPGKNDKRAQQQRDDAEKNPFLIDLAWLHAVPTHPFPALASKAGRCRILLEIGPRLSSPNAPG